MDQLLSKIARLNEIGIALSAASDVDVLCDQILSGAMELTNADGGSLYRMSDDKQALEFLIVLTHSLGIHMGGNSGHAIEFPAIPLWVSGKANRNNVVSAAVHGDCTINIPDAYHAEGYDFSGTRKFDQQTSYRTRSILTIPLKDHRDEIIGVLQLINAKKEGFDITCEFTSTDQQIAESLASQAAVAITNNKLIDEQRRLFDSFIELIAGAIDEKSPYTGGHCKRVPILTMMLAEACHGADLGDLKDFQMTDKDRYELKIAGLLHDCGKITTPEYVVDKATKLETIYDRINTIDTRFELLKRDATIDHLQQKLACFADSKTENFADLDDVYSKRLKAIKDDRDFIRACNIGGEYMDEALQHRVCDIGNGNWTDLEGSERSFLDADEIQNLTVAKGTLTDAERDKINKHMAVTIDMLAQLPFPDHLANVPEYAGGHHERMDGKGYPRGLTREQMSIPARIMGIADIFEALTASDRPYKDGKPLSECLQILGNMKDDNHIDPEIFDVFIREKIYLQYAMEYLNPSQIDEIDEASIPGYEP